MAKKDKKPKSYNDIIGHRESTDNYEAINNIGYVGRYQMGNATLQDLGYTNPKPKGVSQKEWLQNPKAWKGKDGINNLNAFLKNPKIQDKAQDRWNSIVDKRLTNMGIDKYIGKDFGGVKLTKEGARAAAHLIGPTGFMRGLKSGKLDKMQDAYGTKPVEYMKMFDGNKPSPIAMNSTPQESIDIDSFNVPQMPFMGTAMAGELPKRKDPYKTFKDLKDQGYTKEQIKNSYNSLTNPPSGKGTKHYSPGGQNILPLDGEMEAALNSAFDPSYEERNITKEQAEQKYGVNPPVMSEQEALRAEYGSAMGEEEKKNHNLRAKYGSVMTEEDAKKEQEHQTAANILNQGRFVNPDSTVSKVFNPANYGAGKVSYNPMDYGLGVVDDVVSVNPMDYGIGKVASAVKNKSLNPLDYGSGMIVDGVKKAVDAVIPTSKKGALEETAPKNKPSVTKAPKIVPNPRFSGVPGRSPEEVAYNHKINAAPGVAMANKGNAMGELAGNVVDYFQDDNTLGGGFADLVKGAYKTSANLYTKATTPAQILWGTVTGQGENIGKARKAILDATDDGIDDALTGAGTIAKNVASPLITSATDVLNPGMKEALREQDMLKGDLDFAKDVQSRKAEDFWQDKAFKEGKTKSQLIDSLNQDKEFLTPQSYKTALDRINKPTSPGPVQDAQIDDVKQMNENRANGVGDANGRVETGTGSGGNQADMIKNLISGGANKLTSQAAPVNWYESDAFNNGLITFGLNLLSGKDYAESFEAASKDFDTRYGQEKRGAYRDQLIAEGYEPWSVEAWQQSGKGSDLVKAKAQGGYSQPIVLGNSYVQVGSDGKYHKISDLPKGFVSDGKGGIVAGSGGPSGGSNAKNAANNMQLQMAASNAAQSLANWRNNNLSDVQSGNYAPATVSGLLGTEIASAIGMPSLSYLGDTRSKQDEERSFIEAYGRILSGAAITWEEWGSWGGMLFPRPDDSPERIAQKMLTQDIISRQIQGLALGQSIPEGLDTSEKLTGYIVDKVKNANYMAGNIQTLDPASNMYIMKDGTLLDPESGNLIDPTTYTVIRRVL